jgi:hypothetical protein
MDQRRSSAKSSSAPVALSTACSRGVATRLSTPSMPDAYTVAAGGVCRAGEMEMLEADTAVSLSVSSNIGLSNKPTTSFIHVMERSRCAHPEGEGFCI